MYAENHFPLYLDMINDLETDLEEIYDKTQCIKIGSTVHTGSNLCKNYKNLMWSQEPFRV